MEFKEAIEIHGKLFGLTKNEAKEDAEAIVKAMMENEGYTREFAEATFIEDTMDTDPEALKEWEAKAKEANKQHRAKRAPNYSLEGQKKRERKPNEEKRLIITELWHFFVTNAQIGAENAEAVNPEREITFKVGENDYSVTLTCHRKPKK